jgi:hypothetical protein
MTTTIRPLAESEFPKPLLSVVRTDAVTRGHQRQRGRPFGVSEEALSEQVAGGAEQVSGHGLSLAVSAGAGIGLPPPIGL